MKSRDLAKDLIKFKELTTTNPYTRLRLKVMAKCGYVQKKKIYFENSHYLTAFIPTAKLYKKYGE
jgi:hypothetical protein